VTPFTILTGWLGAGKTTALNKILANPGGRRIAVLVNELGRISIDTQLITGAGGDMLELAGGCVCCKVDVKNDLWDGIGDIVERARPDHVVLETTGIAEPAAILEGLVMRGDAANDADDDSVEIKRVRSRGEKLLDRIKPAGVVCVVDAEAGGDALATREEAANQVAAADRILIAKLDVASPEAVVRCHARLDALAAHAERAAFPDDQGRALADWILAQRELRAWRAGTRHVHDHDDGHHHANQLVAISFADDAPLVGARVLAAIEALGDRLVRAKGFVHLADHSRGFLERAGIRTALTDAGPWGEAPRRTELVLIGDGLDEAAIRRALWACRSGG